MPEVSENVLTELAEYRAIGRAPEDVRRKIADLEKDNQKQRSEIDGLKERVKALPAEGAVVIPPGEDATEYAAWKALGLKAADVAKVTKERDDLSAKDVARTRKDVLAAARETEQWNEQAPDVLLDIAGFAEMELTQGDVTVEKTVNGKKENQKAKTAFVTVDGKPVRVSEWVREHKPHIATLLTAQANGNGGSGGGPGIVATEMRGGGGGGAAVRTQEDHTKAVRSKVDYSV